MAGLRGLRTYTMKGSLLIGTSLLLLNVCAEAVAQNADYPLQALREGRKGTSHFSVTVGTDGRAKDCVITKSSGSADLDAETCRMMTMKIGRAHVRPPVTNAHIVCRLLLEKKNKK